MLVAAAVSLVDDVVRRLLNHHRHRAQISIPLDEKDLPHVLSTQRSARPSRSVSPFSCDEWLSIPVRVDEAVRSETSTREG